MSRIIISAPDGKRGMLELTKPLVSIGRGAANDLVLPDNSVSRFHAVIKCQDGQTFIADRNSTNGVVIDGERISGERQLRHNDIAHLGSYELRFEEVRDSGILIKSADIPPTLSDVLRGGSRRHPRRRHPHRGVRRRIGGSSRPGRRDLRRHDPRRDDGAARAQHGSAPTKSLPLPST